MRLNFKTHVRLLHNSRLNLLLTPKPTSSNLPVTGHDLPLHPRSPIISWKSEEQILQIPSIVFLISKGSSSSPNLRIILHFQPLAILRWFFFVIIRLLFLRQELRNNLHQRIDSNTDDKSFACPISTPVNLH